MHREPAGPAVPAAATPVPSRRVRLLTRLLLAAASTAIAASLTGCVAEPSTGAASGTTDVPTAEECQQVASVARYPGSSTTVAVIDRTASGRVGQVSPAIQDELVQAQRRKDQLIVLGVDGAGATPRELLSVALDPRPGDGSEDAGTARAIALRCVAQWLATSEMTPTKPHSDVLNALQAAGRQRPRAVLVIGDGVNTVAPMDLRAIGYSADPADVATALRAGRYLPDLAGVRVVWTQLGETAAPLPQPARRGLEALWRALLTASGAKVTFDSRSESAAAVSSSGTPGGRALPADPLPSASVAQVTFAQSSCYTLPSDLLFSPGSAVPDQRLTAALTPVVRVAAEHPDWAVAVSGHTADYGSVAYRTSLSEQRALSVSAALQQLGIEAGRVTTVGLGSWSPRVPEWTRSGDHDLSAAATNRRVEIVVHAPSHPARLHGVTARRRRAREPLSR